MKLQLFARKVIYAEKHGYRNTCQKKKKKLNPLFEEYIKKCKKKNLIVSIPSEDDGIKETCF